MIHFVGFDQEKIEKYRGSESSFYFDLRSRSLQFLENASPPDFRHGLNIDVTPQAQEIRLKNIFAPEYRLNGNVSFQNVQELPEGWESFFSDEWNTPEDRTKWSYIHQAFVNSFVLIDIPDNAIIEHPLDLSERVIDGPLFSTFLVRVGKNCSVKLLYNRESLDQDFFVSDDLRVSAGENSHVEVITLQNFSREVTNVTRRKSRTARNAQVHFLDLCVGSAYTKFDVRNLLFDQGSEGTIKVLFFGKSKQLFDINTVSVHDGMETNSDIVTKGVLFDRSRALSRGLVKINSESSGSNGYETQEVLLLSEDAEAYAVPNLEIHNHEVKCSHGSSVGQLDKDALFYLMSRGFSLAEAQRTIVEGYFEPILSELSVEVREKIESQLFGSFAREHLTREDAIAALRNVQDPEIPLDLWTLGLIYGIEICEDNSVDITMTFTSPMCPFGAKMMNDVREKLLDAGFSDARVEVVLTPAWKPSEEVKMLLGLA